MATGDHTRKETSMDRGGHNSRETSAPRTRTEILAGGFLHIPAPAALLSLPLCLEIPLVYLDKALGIAALFEAVPDLLRSEAWCHFFIECLNSALLRASHGDFSDLATYMKRTPEVLLAAHPFVAQAGLRALNGREPLLAELLRRPQGKPFSFVYARIAAEVHGLAGAPGSATGLEFDPCDGTARLGPLSDEELVARFTKYQVQADGLAGKLSPSPIPSADSIKHRLRSMKPRRLSLPRVVCVDHQGQPGIIPVSTPTRHDWDALGVCDLSRLAESDMLFLEEILSLVLPALPGLVLRLVGVVNGKLALHCSACAEASFEAPAAHKVDTVAAAAPPADEAARRGIVGTLPCLVKGCTVLLVEPAKVGIKDDLSKYRLVDRPSEKPVAGDPCPNCEKATIPRPYEKGHFYCCPKCGTRFVAKQTFEDAEPWLDFVDAGKRGSR